MSKKVFISFDIDGTLVLCEKNISYHLNAFKQAVSELFGPADEPEKFLGYSVDGWMDKNILKAMIEKLGFEATEENINKAMNRTEEIYCQIATQKVNVPVGIEKLLQTLCKMPNVVIGVASGNLPRIAWHKLELAGISKYFPDRIGGLGIYSSRAEALLAARHIAEEKKNTKFDVAIHVGDTPNDGEAALLAGAIGFMVKTGRVEYPSYPEGTIVYDNMEIGYSNFLELVQ